MIGEIVVLVLSIILFLLVLLILKQMLTLKNHKYEHVKKELERKEKFYSNIFHKTFDMEKRPHEFD